MNDTPLTNLLPESRAREFMRGYFLRLSVLAALMGAFLIFAHGAMLVPSYLYVSEQEQLANERLAELSASLASSEEEEMNARLTRLTEDATRLLNYSATPSSSSIVRAILAVPREGVTLQALSYAPMREGGSRMTISGTAHTREALRAFHQGLSSLPGVVSAELPLSAYAKETDIVFTITLSGTVTP